MSISATGGFTPANITVGPGTGGISYNPTLTMLVNQPSLTSHAMDLAACSFFP